MKKSQILGICILVSVIGIAAYMMNSGQHVESDPFSTTPTSSNKSGTHFFSYKGQEYSKEDFNDELLATLYQQDVRRFQELKTAFLVFAIKKHQRPSLDENKLPPLSSFFQSITKQADFDNWYEERKDKYKGIKNPVQKATLDFQIEKISNAISKDGQKLIDDGVLKLNMKAPKAPLKIIGLDNYPSAGNPDSKNRFVFLSGYTCKLCPFFNKKLRETFIQNKKDVFVTFIPFGVDPTSQDAFFGNIAQCIHMEAPKKFWSFHNYLVIDKELQKLTSMEDVWNLSKKIMTKIELNPSKIDSCLKDKKMKLEVGNLAQRINNFRPRRIPMMFRNGYDVELFK